MSKNKIKFNWSDAWLLLSVIYGGDEGADLERIISVGDGINHDIFNSEELESGLARLISGGHLKEKNGIFMATLRVKSAFAKMSPKRSYIHKDLERIETLIGAARSTDEQPNTNNLKYPGFSEAAYIQAVNKYLERFSKREKSDDK
jgi:hypothetical protein